MSVFLQKYRQLLNQTKQIKKSNGVVKVDEQFLEQQQIKFIKSIGGKYRNANLLDLIQTNSSSIQQNQRFQQLITYRIQGNTIDQYVSDLYLQQKINNIIGQNKKQEDIACEEEQYEEQKKMEKKTPRYFEETNSKQTQMRFARCYRCSKRGHIQKYCPQAQEPIKCMYCMKEHHHNSCNTKACFQCNQIGHLAKDCYLPKLKCLKCGNKGHLDKDCGVIVFLNYQKNRLDRVFRQRYTFDDLVNLRCLASCRYPVGHFNCYQYQKKREQCYSQSIAQKTIERQKFILSNFSKLRQKYYKQQVSRNVLAKPNKKIEQLTIFKQNLLQGQMEVQQ